MKLIPFIVAALLIPMASNAQDQPTTGAVADAQIIIEKNKPLTLPRANRLFEKAKFENHLPDSVYLSYGISNPQFVTVPYDPNINIRNFRPAKNESTNSAFLKLGFGNYGSPYAFLALHGQKNQMTGNVWLRHESFQKGGNGETSSAFGKTELELSGKYAHAFGSIKPVLQYEHTRANLFAFNQDNWIAQMGDISYPGELKGDFVLFALEGVKSNKEESIMIQPFIAPGEINQVGRDYLHELTWGLNSSYQKKLNQGEFQAHQKFSQLNLQSGFRKRSALHLGGLYAMTWDQMEANVGLAYGLSNDQIGTKHYVFPKVYFMWNPIDALAFSLLVDGDVNPLSLRKLNQINPYLSDSLNISNEVIPIQTTLALAYKLSNTLTVRPYFGYMEVKNKQFFQFNPSDTASFSIIRESGKFSQVKVGIKMQYQNPMGTSISSTLELMSYQTATLAEAWYQPGTRWELALVQPLFQKGLLRANIEVLDGLIGAEPVTNIRTELPAIANINVGFNYQIQQHWTGYIEFDNLLNQDNEWYLNYPVVGLSGKIGFIYQF